MLKAAWASEHLCMRWEGVGGYLMGLDKSMLISRWHCDTSQALEVTHWRCLQYHALLEVIIIDLLND